MAAAHHLIVQEQIARHALGVARGRAGSGDAAAAASILARRGLPNAARTGPARAPGLAGEGPGKTTPR
jgi:hypothetical protein